MRVKRYLNRYMGMALAVLLVLAALLVPQGWFALRDGALAGRVQGEALSPLMVAQLDSSYEHDIRRRISQYLAAVEGQNVICSAKEIDPGNESLRENMEQAESSLLMEALRSDKYVLTAEELGGQSAIESCMQYVLMRQSDGQILLVANDIRLDKGNGCHMELLLDGVDGTVYYLESEEDRSPSHLLREWMSDRAWLWWQILNESYGAGEEGTPEDGELEVTSEGVSYVTWAADGDVEEVIAYYPYGGGYLRGLSVQEIGALTRADQARLYGGDYPAIWISSVPDRDIYCCQLTYGEHVGDWTMELEELETGYQIRLGLPCVPQAIPDMAERASLAEYDQIYTEGQ